ncbi:hypothetical protein GOV07_02065 [Candidatus Woesearchaeota archaeon]|nr:hypothetical protein [Candidatus Woesearchaeota archaeon]
MRGVRAQVTVFILVGLAVLIVFILIFALARRLNTYSPVTQGYDTQAVTGHIEQCMDLVAKDAFTLLGAQGGRLYTSQGGLHDTTLTADITPDGGGIPVTLSFGLMLDSGFPLRPKFAGQYVGVLDEYPYPFPQVDITTIYPTTIPDTPQHIWHRPRFDGVFGQDALPLPCENSGANTRNGTFHCARHLYPLLSQGPSVQDSLESFFTYKLGTCIDEDELAILLGANVQTGDLNVTITFTPSETAVDLLMPLSFSNEGGSFKTGTFTRRYKARTYTLFAFAHALIDRATKNPFFRIEDTGDQASLGENDGFVVTKTELPAARADGRDDLSLVTIADPKSQVDNGMWFFSFLVQNREPVLGYVAPITIENGATLQDFVTMVDPDGDELELSLNGGIASKLTITGTTLAVASDTPLGPHSLRLTLTETESTRKDWQDITLIVVEAS